MITFEACAEDGIERTVSGFKVVRYDMPQGCCGAYYPETNPLLALAHRDERSNTPASKSVPVKVVAMTPGAPVSSEPEVSETHPEGAAAALVPEEAPAA
jgi:hypothetical protein